MSLDSGPREMLKWLGLWPLIVAAAIIGVLAICPGATAHEWYPLECCSDRDCWIAGEGGAEPEPRAGPSGYVLHDGTLIPYHEARPSPDGRYHVCRHGGSLLGRIIRTDGRPCLWVPQQGS